MRIKWKEFWRGFIIGGVAITLFYIINQPAYATDKTKPTPRANQCAPAPSPSPKKPKTTPSPTPKVVKPTATPTPTSAPQPTSTPKKESKPSKSPKPSKARAPQCEDKDTSKPMANFHVYRKGPTVLAKWLPTEGSDAIIYYKRNGLTYWEHAFKTENDGYEYIYHLGSDDWTFAGQQVNSCAGGPLTPEVIDGDTDGWVLFV